MDLVLEGENGVGMEEDIREHEVETLSHTVEVDAFVHLIASLEEIIQLVGMLVKLVLDISNIIFYITFDG